MWCVWFIACRSHPLIDSCFPAWSSQETQLRPCPCLRLQVHAKFTTQNTPPPHPFGETEEWPTHFFLDMMTHTLSWSISVYVQFLWRLVLTFNYNLFVLFCLFCLFWLKARSKPLDLCTSHSSCVILAIESFVCWSQSNQVLYRQFVKHDKVRVCVVMELFYVEKLLSWKKCMLADEDDALVFFVAPPPSVRQSKTAASSHSRGHFW